MQPAKLLLFRTKSLVIFSLFLFPGLSLSLSGQAFTSYFTGSQEDFVISGRGGVCLMGGATEDEGAMRWFLRRANGGDVLVLRTSGSDGYNSFFYSELGVDINSVETIVCHELAAASDAYVLQRIRQAEAIWFAGGDQWNHLSRWQNTPLEDALRTAVSERSAVIGGTSAGMAILGGAYFSARNGTVRSDAALANPYDSRVALDNDPLVDLPYLREVITDTHYDDPDRRGRHLVFLARAYMDYGIPFRGIACEEYTAVCIDPDGLASVFGGFPDFNDNAYFISPNCQLTDARPERCAPNTPLEWNHDGQALQVYKVKGTPTGLYNFDLNNWQTGRGGDWEYWAADAGSFFNQLGDQPGCSPVGGTTSGLAPVSLTLWPNPVSTRLLQVRAAERMLQVQVFSSAGQLLRTYRPVGRDFSLPTDQLAVGLHWLRVRTRGGEQQAAFVVIRDW
jgi:cyanophycinase-like exopeptidase